MPLCSPLVDEVPHGVKVPTRGGNPERGAQRRVGVEITKGPQQFDHLQVHVATTVGLAKQGRERVLGGPRWAWDGHKTARRASGSQSGRGAPRVKTATGYREEQPRRGVSQQDPRGLTGGEDDRPPDRPVPRQRTQ